MPPIRSVFLDYGPYTDFFGETGPYLVRIVCEKSGFMLMLLWLGESSCSTSKQIGQKHDFLVYIQGQILTWGVGEPSKFHLSVTSAGFERKQSD